jgi:hypothetical protein
MVDIHPKTLYEHGPFKKSWPFRAKLPRLQHIDFARTLDVLTNELVIEQFEICEIMRSQDTGEFYYSNSDDEWMPESCLLDTDIAARRECSRILRLIKKWIDLHQV